MLALTRKAGESILIFPSDDIPKDMTIEQLFEDGPVEIKFVDSRYKNGVTHVKLGIEAPKEIIILRDELWVDEEDEDDQEQGANGNK